jgi:hypothetical protein
MSLAIESRQRVVSQLAVIAPREFSAVLLEVSPIYQRELPREKRQV